MVQTPHQVQTVLEAKGHHWLTGRRFTKYQVIFLGAPYFTLKVCQSLNSATWKPEENPIDQEVIHFCVETTEQDFSSWPDLKDQAIENPNEE